MIPWWVTTISTVISLTIYETLNSLARKKKETTLLIAPLRRMGSPIAEMTIRKVELLKLLVLLDSWQPLILHVDDGLYYKIEGRIKGGGNNARLNDR
jgi:hypothetical protein